MRERGYLRVLKIVLYDPQRLATDVNVHVESVAVEMATADERAWSERGNERERHTDTHIHKHTMKDGNYESERQGVRERDNARKQKRKQKEREETGGRVNPESSACVVVGKRVQQKVVCGSVAAWIDLTSPGRW